jgi:hypothetical protein
LRVTVVDPSDTGSGGLATRAGRPSGGGLLAAPRPTVIAPFPGSNAERPGKDKRNEADQAARETEKLLIKEALKASGVNLKNLPDKRPDGGDKGSRPPSDNNMKKRTRPAL